MIIKYYLLFTNGQGADQLYTIDNRVVAFSTQADANKEATQLLLKNPMFKYHIVKKMGELYNGLIHDEIRERDTVMR